MKADEFIEILALAAPPLAELEAAGLDAAEIAEVRAIYSCPRRMGATARGDGELQRLLVEYDCTSLEIASLAFCSPTRQHVQGVLVGQLEADPLVVLADGRIVLLDHAEPDSSPGEVCALSEERFLAALARSVRSGVGGRGRSAGRIQECADLAGVQTKNALWVTIAG